MGCCSGSPSDPGGKGVTQKSVVAEHTASRYVLSPDVVFLALDDGTARLLDLDGSFFGLSDIAAEMLKGTLDQGIAATVQRIAAEYDGQLERVQADLAALLGKLRTKSLIRLSDDPLPAVKLRAAIAIAISFPALRILGLLRNQRLKAGALLALARACFAVAGWARTVEAWQKCLKRPHDAVSNLEQEQLIDAIDGATRRSASALPSIACKERALCCWFMLHSAGVPVKLVMGVQFFPFSGHCWCEVGDRILTDFPERCKAYTPVISYEG